LALNVYECLFILDANRYARDPGGVSGSIPKMVEGAGGELLASRLWIEQKLAYPIRGQRKGTYWLTYFRMDSDKLGEFNRACQLNDGVVRNLVIKVEPRLVDALVSHALGKTPAPDSTGSSDSKQAPSKKTSNEAEKKAETPSTADASATAQ
jgi:small subunit ribosomal protein S6